MKNYYLILVVISSTLFQSTTLISQSKFSWIFESGITYGDANYGNEFALEYLENEDYNSIGASNDADYGFNLNLGVLYHLNKNSELSFSAGYLLFGTEILGNLNDLKSTINRPFSITIPVRVEGRINHSFLDLGGDYIYNFNGHSANGFNISVGMHYLFLLNTNWKVDVDFERGNTGVQNDLSEVADTDLNNILATNIKLGYNIILKDKYRINPSFGFNLGLNELSDEDSLSPTFFSLGVRFNRLK